MGEVEWAPSPWSWLCCASVLGCACPGQPDLPAPSGARRRWAGTESSLLASLPCAPTPESPHSVPGSEAGGAAPTLPLRCLERSSHPWRVPWHWTRLAGTLSCVPCATRSTSAPACWIVSMASAVAACMAGLSTGVCSAPCASECQPRPTLP